MLTYYFPENWRREGIKEPNKFCEDITKRIIYILEYEYKLVPEKIEPNIKSSLVVSYFNSKNFRQIDIEITKDSKVISKISDELGCKVLIEEEITNFNFKEILQKFLE